MAYKYTRFGNKFIFDELCEVAEGKDSESVIALECRDGNLHHLRGIVIASHGSPIEGYILFVDIDADHDSFPPYPLRPPRSIRFKNKLWHPRVNSDGVVSLADISYLGRQVVWSLKKLTLETILATLQVLLTDVGEDLDAKSHFLNDDAIKQYLQNRELYKKTALKCTEQDNEGYGRQTFSDYRLRALRSFLHLKQIKYKVYVYCQKSGPLSWTLSLVIVPNFYTFRYPAEQCYQHYMKLTTFHFCLNGVECISIDFGSGATRDQCWKITSVSAETIVTDEIRKADPRLHYEPSAFKLKLEWINLHSPPQRFLHKFNIVDSKAPKTLLHSFDVCLDPTSLSPSGLLPDTKYYERPSMVEVVKFQSNDPRRSTPIDLTEKVGPRFMKFGTLLLDDSDGNKMGSLRVDMIGRSCSDIVCEIFRRWLGGEGKQPTTWSTIVEVLYDIQLPEYARVIESTKNE